MKHFDYLNNLESSFFISSVLPEMISAIFFLTSVVTQFQGFIYVYIYIYIYITQLNRLINNILPI